MKALEAVTGISASWEECASFPEGKVQRISLLRELCSRLHALRSEALALDDQSLILSIDRIESRLDQLRISFEWSFETIQDLTAYLLSNEPPAPPLSDSITSLPDALLAALGGPEKLSRSDRAWERALALYAHKIGWKFWELTADVVLEEVESWHQDLKARLWPKGVLLYVESSPTPPHHPKAWRGRWIVLLDPTTNPPHQDNASHSRWKLLFPSSGT